MIIMTMMNERIMKTCTNVIGNPIKVWAILLKKFMEEKHLS